MNLFRKLWISVAVLALIAFVALAVACSDDDDDDGGDGGNGDNAAERQEVADVVLALATTNGAEATEEEIDFYMEHVTDSFLQEFGTESVEICRQDAATCIGEPLPAASVTPDDVEIDGDSAKVVFSTDICPFGVDLTQEDDVWKATGLFVPDDEIAEGTDVVDVDLVDFAFEGDLESDAVKSGEFAFHFTNAGEQPHEAVLVALPEEGTIEELLQDESFEPEPIFVKFGYDPGDASDVALPAPLDPGRYGLVCFLPDIEDPEMTPHAFKGMVAEFTVE